MKNAGDKKKKKIDALDSIKFKHFCASKDTIETAERQQAGRGTFLPAIYLTSV